MTGLIKRNQPRRGRKLLGREIFKISAAVFVRVVVTIPLPIAELVRRHALLSTAVERHADSAGCVHAEVFIAVVLTVRSVVAHQRVRNTVQLAPARERRRERIQGSVALFQRL